MTNFHPVTDRYDQTQLHGELAPNDVNWTCPSGLSTETSTWYITLEDGSFFINQIIYSPVGLFNPQVQMTFRYFHPKTGENVWKSKNVDSFQLLPNDKRSCKSNCFSVTLRDLPEGGQAYDISASLDKDVQLTYTLTRPAQAKGWKLGNDEKGGFSYFGENVKTPDGYVVHRFWPYAKANGVIVLNGRVVDVNGQAMFVQAIQGMRPNLVASRWNFGNFQSSEQGGTSAIVMEFTTTCDYGKSHEADAVRVPQVVTIGSIVCGGQLVAVVGATHSARDTEQRGTHIEHSACVKDDDTGYDVPQQMKFVLEGPALVGVDKVSTDVEVKASIDVDLGEPKAMHGLIEKVDVLSEIPYMVRKLVNYVAGTKPYIYQTLNSTQLKLELPEPVAKAVGASDTSLTLSGSLFEEHTFIS